MYVMGAEVLVVQSEALIAVSRFVAVRQSLAGLMQLPGWQSMIPMVCAGLWH